ncbi:MAG: glycosyltransferase family 4 protein [bacterium]|nr:glycosyltransferase family 4 protein [bacterium]
MRVVQLIPGTGGTFYCQNCMRDAGLMRALRRRGLDVIMTPLYLPVNVDADEADNLRPVFFGGINVYLQQKFGFFRKTPRWLDRFFDSPWMLRQAAAREGSTSASALGPMTLSMLRGRDGNQRKEVERLVSWLQQQDRPDIVHISNSLLLGMASEIKKALNVPIVCSLQDEHTWLDMMKEPHRTQCWEAMSERGRDVDAFVAVSNWYADEMVRRMAIPREKIAVVPVGMELDGIEPATAPADPPVIGYLSRMSEDLGIGRLVEAFLQIKQDPRMKSVRLRATGGSTAEDRPFLEKLRLRIREAGVENDVDLLERFDKDARHDFLRSLSVLSVPVPEGEAFGTFIVEALACGVPVVEPAVGAFPEVIEPTGGGILFDPNDAQGLTKGLSELLLDPARARDMGQRGRAAVLTEYNVETMAERMLPVYNALLES